MHLAQASISRGGPRRARDPQPDELAYERISVEVVLQGGHASERAPVRDGTNERVTIYLVVAKECL